MYKKNDYLIIDITDLGNEGEGIGHAEGYAIFVNGAIPGDKLKVKIIKAKKKYAIARIEEIIKPSPDRIENACPYALRCGGCRLQSITYEKELEWKAKKVLNCITRLGGYREDEFDFDRIVGIDSINNYTNGPAHYRNKAQFPVGTDKDNNIITGFYAGRSHNIIPNTDCMMQDEIVKYVNEAVIKFMEDSFVKAYDEESHTGIVRHIVTKVGIACGDVMVCLVVTESKSLDREKLVSFIQNGIKESGLSNRHLSSVCLNINKEKGNVILGRKTLCIYGNSYIEDKIGDIKYHISAVSFYQVNPYQTQKLYNAVKEFADFKGDEVVYDLYCGIGTISLFVAKNVKQVIGVEIVPQAIEDAKENALINSIKNASFHAGEAEVIIPKLYEESGGNLKADVVILDPPRKGCDERLIRTVAKMKPKKAIYVSCDPATLARDLKLFRQLGYELKKARAYDMFGRSTHVETVVLMSRFEGK